jgi:MATE family multidrug resistance protein
MFSSIYKKYYKEIFILALPVAVGQIGHMFTSFADSVMVGHLGSNELAAVSLAGSLIIIPTLLAVGISIGLTPLVGKAFGEKNIKKINLYFYHALVFNFLMGIILSFLVYLSVPFLKYLEQPPEVLEKSIPYFLIMNFSLIPYMFVLTAKQFTEGIQLTKPGMYVSVLGNLLNVLLNYFLIFGKFGFPSYGVLGAGIASFIARSAMALGFMIYLYQSDFKKYVALPTKLKLEIKKFHDILKIGFPIGVQFTLEVGVFSIGAIMIGWFGSVSLAAHQIALNFASLTFVMASGLATAATIKVSNLIGQQKFKEMRIAGLSSLVLAMAFMSFTAFIFIVFRHQLPYLFTNEANLIEESAKLLLVAAFFQIFDGIQVVGLGNLRGMADVKFATIVALISYWIIGIPTSYLFGIVLNLKAQGVWIGYLFSLAIASAFFAIRFLSKSKLAIKNGIYF